MTKASVSLPGNAVLVLCLRREDRSALGAGTRGVFSPRDRSRGLGCDCSRRLSALYLRSQGLEARARSLGPLSASADVSAELGRGRGGVSTAPARPRPGVRGRLPPRGPRWCGPAAGAFAFLAPRRLRPGLLLAGGPAARPPPVGAAMMGSGAAAGCVRLLLELLRWVSPGLGSRGPGGAERVRRGKLAGAQRARPACTRLLFAAGKGAGDPEGNVELPEGPAPFSIPESICLNIIYFEQGSVTRGNCRKLEFLGDETSYLRGHLAGAGAKILIPPYFPQ